MRPEATEIRSRVGSPPARVAPRARAEVDAAAARPGGARAADAAWRCCRRRRSPARSTSRAAPTNSNETAPSIAVDPTNPQKLVAVWTRDTPTQQHQQQPDVHLRRGGLLDQRRPELDVASGSLGNARTDFDQSQANGRGSSPRSPTPASPSTATTSSTSSARPTPATTAAARSCCRSSTSAAARRRRSSPTSRSTAGPRTRRSGRSLAVDSNLATFTDPDVPGYVQTDPFAGNVYVAWSTNNVAPATVPTNFNPNAIKIVASSDAVTATLASPVAPRSPPSSTSTTAATSALDRNATPRLAISQGRPIDTAVYGAGDQGVPGGQVTIVWDDSARGRRQPAARPDRRPTGSRTAAPAAGPRHHRAGARRHHRRRRRRRRQPHPRRPRLHRRRRLHRPGVHRPSATWTSRST